MLILCQYHNKKYKMYVLEITTDLLCKWYNKIQVSFNVKSLLKLEECIQQEFLSKFRKCNMKNKHEIHQSEWKN